MKPFLTFLCACCLAMGLAAQTAHTEELWLSVGFSNPLGDYASASLNSNSSGFANTGGTFRLNYQHNVNEHFGVTAILGLMNNGIEAEKIAQTYGSSIKAADRSWVTSSVLVGAVGRIPSGPKVSFEGRVALGLANISFGGLHLTDLNSNTLDQSSASSAAFAYLVGIGLKFHVSDKVIVPLTVDYTGCKGSFNSNVTNNGTLIATSSFDMYVQSLNVSLGVGFMF